MKFSRGSRLLIAALLLIHPFLAVSAHAEKAVALASGNVLLFFDTASPGTVAARIITGIAPGQNMRAIDVRPSTGELYGSAVQAAVFANQQVFTYKIDPETAVATKVGETASTIARAGDVPTGYDFNPVIAVTPVAQTEERIRYVNTNNENIRINPVSGALAGDDPDLTPAATTTIIGAAYDRNSPGSTSTTLYEIDRNDSQLSRQGGIDGSPSPNGGVVTDLRPLGFALTASFEGGFDISPTGEAFAALSPVSTNLFGLYTIALTNVVTVTPAATFVGLIGNGISQVLSLAILTTNTDGDSLTSNVDNCPGTSNQDQADLDGDGKGDACDPDQDGDGIPDQVENAAGSNPRSGDSDGDGLADGPDACPNLAASTPDGCPALCTAILPSVVGDPPDTGITNAPPDSTSRTAVVEFNSSQSGSGFECALDKGGFQACSSPARFAKLRPGSHSVRVRSINSLGILDTTPASAAWKVVKRKRRKR